MASEPAPAAPPSPSAPSAPASASATKLSDWLTSLVMMRRVVKGQEREERKESGDGEGNNDGDDVVEVETGDKAETVDGEEAKEDAEEAIAMTRKDRQQDEEPVGYVKRADPAVLKAVFDKYASESVDGEKFMTEVDFLVRYLGLFPEENYNVKSAHLMSGVLDTSKDK